MKLARYLLLFICIFSSSIVLEELTLEEKHHLLSNKKIGYFIGSFDPIHKGHQEIISTIIKNNLVDYCIVYPVWGGDEYKNRTDINIRLEMLFSLYQNNSKIIVTKLPPVALQKALTIDSPTTLLNKPTVIPSTSKTTYVGILGSDAALKTASDVKKRSVFMKGIKIPEKYYYHSAGNVIALPVNSFIVFVRKGDDISVLKGKIHDSPIISTFEHNDDISSTQIRNMIKENKDVTSLLAPSVLEIINKEALYQ